MSNFSGLIFDQKVLSEIFFAEDDKSCKFFQKICSEFQSQIVTSPMLSFELIGGNSKKLKKLIIERHEKNLKELKYDMDDLASIRKFINTISKEEFKILLTEELSSNSSETLIRNRYEKYKKPSTDLRSEWIDKIFQSLEDGLKTKPAINQIWASTICFESVLQMSLGLKGSEVVKNADNGLRIPNVIQQFLFCDWYYYAWQLGVSPIRLCYDYAKEWATNRNDHELANFHYGDSGDAEYLWYLLGGLPGESKPFALITRDDLESIKRRLKYSLGIFEHLVDSPTLEVKSPFIFYPGLVIQINENWEEVGRFDVSSLKQQIKTEKVCFK